MKQNIDQTEKPVLSKVQVSELSIQELIDLKLQLEVRMNVIIKELRRRIQT